MLSSLSYLSPIHKPGPSDKMEVVDQTTNLTLIFFAGFKIPNLNFS